MKTLDCEFGATAALGEGTSSLSVRIDRSRLTLDEADTMLVGRRIVGKVSVRPEGDAEGQTYCVDGLCEELACAFDCKGVRVTPKYFSARLSFANRDTAGHDLSRFCKRAGTVTIDSAESLDAFPDDDGDADAAPADAADPKTLPAGAWREADVGQLELPKAVVAKLRKAGYETLGKLEDLRGSRDFGDGLRSIAGVGEAKAQQIEDAILKWLSKNRDAEALAAARDGQLAARTPAEETRWKAIAARVDALDTGEAGCLEPKNDKTAWSLGSAARSAGLLLDACPYDHHEAECDDWLRGWLSERLLESFDDALQADPAEAGSVTNG